ncbi:MAG: protein-L-isoaspartate(D-aspartate) O-methyltransferase [Bryobacterales bacterium]|nr:protein-L-isoaspartate(D-aspartate) O-methyltransferase [Bryobacterales bacterium]
MVERQLRSRGIRDERLLSAMGTIPRERFVPLETRLFAYQDAPLAIGHGQTISQPYITALMVECLALQGHEIVLDIGSGSGYHAAVLSYLAREVYSVEIIPELTDLSRRNLAAAGCGLNIRLFIGDGSMGCPEAPAQGFDAISVTAGAPSVPEALLTQLRDPGRMVIPVGPHDDQELLVVEKRDGVLHSRTATHCRFVPLRGGAGWRTAR